MNQDYAPFTQGQFQQGAVADATGLDNIGGTYLADGTIQDPRGRRIVPLANTNCPGNARPVNRSSASQCGQSCLASPNCKSWSYDDSNNKCYLNNNTPMCNLSADHTSGRIVDTRPWYNNRPPAPAPQVQKIVQPMNNVAFPITDGQSSTIYARSAAECQSAAMQGAFNGFSFNPRAQGPSCTLNRGQPQQLITAQGTQSGQIFNVTSIPQSAPTAPIYSAPWRQPVQSAPPSGGWSPNQQVQAPQTQGWISNQPVQAPQATWAPNQPIPQQNQGWQAPTIAPWSPTQSSPWSVAPWSPSSQGAPVAQNINNGANAAWDNVKDNTAPVWNNIKDALAPAFMRNSQTSGPIVSSQWSPVVQNIQRQLTPLRGVGN